MFTVYFACCFLANVFGLSLRLVSPNTFFLSSLWVCPSLFAPFSVTLCSHAWFPLSFPPKPQSTSILTLNSIFTYIYLFICVSPADETWIHIWKYIYIYLPFYAHNGWHSFYLHTLCAQIKLTHLYLRKYFSPSWSEHCTFKSTCNVEFDQARLPQARDERVE